MRWITRASKPREGHLRAEPDSLNVPPEDNSPATAQQGVVTAPTSRQLQQLAAFAVGILVLAVVRDGFPGEPGSYLPQALLAPFTLLFIGAILLFLATRPRLSGAWAMVSRQPAWRLTLIFTLLAQALAVGLLVLEARYFAHLGYQLHPSPLVATFAGCTGALLVLIRGTPSAGVILAVVLAAATLMTLLSITSFPLVAARSDMLPLLSRASADLLQGHNPYHFYLFAHGRVFLTYLPGTLMAYVPFQALSLDLRVGTLCYGLIAALCLYASTAPGERREMAAAIGALYLSPYFQYRHELYTAPHWLSLAAWLLLQRNSRPLLAAAVFGVSMSLSQLSWVMLPFICLHVLRTRDLKAAVLTALISLGCFALILAPFMVVASPQALLYGVLTHWSLDGVLQTRAMNLSFWVTRVLSPDRLQPLQGLVLVAIFGYCWLKRRCMSLESCCAWMTVGVCAFVLLNRLVWEYFYLLVLMMLLMVYAARQTHAPGQAPEGSGEPFRSRIPQPSPSPSTSS